MPRDKNRYLNILSQTLLPLCMGMIGALIIILFNVYYFSPLTIGTVNLTGIIDHFIKDEAKQSLSPEQLKAQVHLFSQQLEKILNTISNEKHVILLPREAVLAGNIDYTTLVESLLKEKQQIEAKK